MICTKTNRVRCRVTQRYLLDSSILVNLTKRDSACRDKLLTSIENGIVVHHCEPVVMEVISGARPGEDFIMQSRLDSFSSLPHDLHSDYRRAGMMYRDLRRKGITIRNVIDCLIAVIAMSHENVTLIHDDEDFERIAQHYELKQERWVRAA